MKILFAMSNFWYIKHYETVIRELAGRGHQVLMAAESDWREATTARSWNAAAEAFAASTPNVRLEWMPPPASRIYPRVALRVRGAVDYLRYLQPRYRNTPGLGARARRLTPRWLRYLVSLWPFNTGRGRTLVSKALRRLDAAIPIDPRILDYLDGERPDVVLITPLVTLASGQFDLLRAARRRGLHALAAIGSWDHLSSKALIRVQPDRLMVWNETQAEEARLHHGVAPDRVVVTGAQCFDEWFGCRPSRSREEFLRSVGLPEDRPFVFYACSSLLGGSPDEAPFVVRWIGALRAHPRLAGVSVLVRPHPKRSREWTRVDTHGFAGVRVWPPVGTAPITTTSRADYFDSLYYASAVVGLNTTALIEAGVIGRPVLTLVLPEYRNDQEGTIHFRYLTDVGGGLLEVSYSLDEHLEQLAHAIASTARPRQPFLEAFVRPRGMTLSATTIFADEVEAAVRVAPLGPPEKGLGIAATLASAALWGAVLLPMMAMEVPGAIGDRLAEVRRQRRRALEQRQRELARDLRLEEHRRRKRELQETVAPPPAAT